MNWKANKEYWRALQVSLVFQTVLGLLASLAMDGGLTLHFWLVTMFAFWVGLVLIVTRRPMKPTRTDLFLIRWAFPIVLVFVTGPVSFLVWRLRGFSY